MNPGPENLLVGLPGADLIQQGLEEHRQGRHTIGSCLVRIASPRLAAAGLLPSSVTSSPDAELELYSLLAHEGDLAYPRYNALIRQLVSFEHALDHRQALGVGK